MSWLYRLKSKLSRRSLRFFWQRLTRGWDDSETWSLDHSLAKLITPRLKRYKEVNCGYPSSMSWEEWNEILDEMIFGFEWFQSDARFDVNSEYDANYIRAQKGIDLFAKHYFHLWW